MRSSVRVSCYQLVRLIDSLDARLIEELRENPRVGLLEISRRLEVARGTVQARLAKLEQRGVITGYGPEVEPEAMGYPILALMLLDLAQGRLEEAVEALEACPRCSRPMPSRARTTSSRASSRATPSTCRRS